MSVPDPCAAVSDLTQAFATASTPPIPGCSTLFLSIERVVAAAFAVPADELHAATRGAQHAALARQGAMYLARVIGGLSYSEIGRAFGRDRTTAAHACIVIEERRENPQMDAPFSILETACEQMIASPATDGLSYRGQP